MLSDMTSIFFSFWFAVIVSVGHPALEQLVNDEAVLKKADLKSDAASLIAFLQKRSLPEEERGRVKALIEQLGSQVYKEREQAMADITAISSGSASANPPPLDLHASDIKLLKTNQSMGKFPSLRNQGRGRSILTITEFSSI